MRFTPATMRAALTRAESRVDFSMVSARAISIETEATLKVAQLTARAAKRIVDRIPELITSDVDAIGNLRIDSTDVGKIKDHISLDAGACVVIGAVAGHARNTEGEAQLYAGMSASTTSRTCRRMPRCGSTQFVPHGW